LTLKGLEIIVRVKEAGLMDSPVTVAGSLAAARRDTVSRSVADN